MLGLVNALALVCIVVLIGNIARYLDKDSGMFLDNLLKLGNTSVDYVVSGMGVVAAAGYLGLANLSAYGISRGALGL